MRRQRGCFKEMTEKLRKNLIGMRKESMAKFNSARENFEKERKGAESRSKRGEQNLGRIE